MTSGVGYETSAVAMPLLILSMMGTTTQLGLYGALGSLPVLLLSLPAGVLADRCDRVRLAILCELGRAAISASVPLALVTGHLSVLQLYAVALLGGSLFVLFDAADSSLLPSIVSRQQLPAALAANNVMFGSASLLGPALGGVLYAAGGPPLPLVVNSVSYLASALSLLLIGRTGPQGRGDGTPFRRDVLAGVRFVCAQPSLRALALLSLGTGLVLSASSMTVVVIARQLHLSPTGLGVTLSAGAVGTLVGSALSVPAARHIGPHRVLTLGLPSMAGIWVLYTLATTAFMLACITFMLFACSTIVSIAQTTVRLWQVRADMQGRVGSCFRLLAWGSQPVGLLLLGGAFSLVGVRHTLLISAAVLPAFGLMTTLPALTGNSRTRAAAEAEPSEHESTGQGACG